MDSIERLIGELQEFKVNAIDHRKVMETKFDKMATSIDEIKEQTTRTNGRVLGHDATLLVVNKDLTKLSDAFYLHAEKGIKTDSYLKLFWRFLWILAGATLSFSLNYILKTK